MKLITFSSADTVGYRTGLYGKNNTVHDITDEYGTMNTLISGERSLEPLKYLSELEGSFRADEIKILAPVPQPMQDIICLGINYMEHAEESARFKKEDFNGERKYPVYFSKRVNEALPDGGVLKVDNIPDDSVDYEAELAFIIGRDAKNISENEAENFIFGYTIINDISARTIQTKYKQWYFGKSLDGFTPMGPYIVTSDEISFPPKLNIKSFVNGELRQNSNTSKLIFNIPYVISNLSQGMTLKAGTIISTGTPAGVGMGFSPPKFLHKGDTVQCEIENIGTLTTHID